MPGYRIRLNFSRPALFSGLVVIFSLTAGLVFGQDPHRVIITAPDPTSGLPQTRPLKPGEAVVQVRQGGQSLGQYSIEAKGPDSPDDPVNVIVELREEPGGLPLVARQPLSLPQAVEREAARQIRIRSVGDEILQLENGVRGQRRLAPALRSQVVRHEFGLLFNGLSATVRRSTLAAIEQLPKVRRVWPDREVTAYLDKSVPLIGADRAGAQLGLTGQGVTVAVVDTGVDYTHPDLGAGFGPGFKVVGGYDAFNKDDDPMDDAAHGTHVAGIIAANGKVRGVAPDARILAVKVLGAAGNGSASTIISGIEWSVKNGAQVINMSLGGPGTPDDPVSQAVDNAVQAGVVVVVAAGNSGPSFYTLGSPGMARQALTVGAVDTSDKLAPFSSRGPAPDTFQIKPEIVAPGVGITSTVPRGSCAYCDPSGYRRANGTSMASPHVAGAAALLLQAHAGWTPAQVRAALLAGSRHLDLHTFAQGNGRLDVFAAASATTHLSQGNFSVGLDDLSGPLFSSSGSLVVVNSSSAPVSYSATIDGHFPAGVTLLLSPSQFVLGPGQSQSVDFQVQVDNLLVPSASEYPCDYSGGVLLHEGEKAFRLPFSFLKGAILDIDSGEEGQNGLVFVHNPKLLLVFERHTHHRRVVVPDGRHDVVAFYAGLIPTLVFREGIESSGRKTIKVTNDEAAHIVRMDTVSQDGTLAVDPSQPSISFTILRHDTSELYLGIIVGRAADVYLWSDVSSKYVVDFSLLLSPSASRPGYIFMHGVNDGINQSRVLRNTPADLRAITLRHGLADAGKRFVTFHCLEDGGVAVGPVTSPGSAPFQEEWRLMAEPRPDFAGGYLATYAYSEDVHPENFLYSTSPLRLSKRDLTIGTVSENGILPYRSIAASDLPCGIGPYHWDARFENEPGTVSVSLPGKSGWFRGQTGDQRRAGPINFHLWAGNTELASGPLSSSTRIPVSPGTYRFEAGSNFLAGDGRPAAITADFDTGRNDPNPPRLLNVQLLSHGVPVDAVPPEGAVMGVRAGDDQAVAAISAFLDSGSGWVQVPGRLEAGGWYFVTFPPLRSGVSELHFRFVITDSAGNTLSYESSAPVIGPDLSLQASHRGKLTSGGELEYLLTITGLGRTPAGGPITVIDELPPGMAFVAAEGTGWSCAPQAGDASRIRCTRHAPVPPGGASTIVLRVKALQSALPVSVNRATLVCRGDSIFSNDSAVDVVSGREGDGWQALGPDGGPIRFMAATRGPAPVVYAATDRLLFKSTDRGETWTSCASPVEDMDPLSVLVVHPKNDQLAYAVVGYTLFRSRDGASSWQAISSTIFTLKPRVDDLAIDPVNPSILYLTEAGRVYKTSDGGETWLACGPALDTPNLQSLAIAPSRPDIIYARGPKSLWRTSDAGKTWSKMAEIGTSCLAVHPLDSETVYIGGSSGGVSRSTDGGLTWQNLNPGLGTVSSLVVDIAADKSVRIAALSAGSVTRSLDGGQSWATLGSTADYQKANALAGAQDDLFLGTPSGVFRFAPSSNGWQFTSRGLFGALILSLARGSDGATYAATEQGLMVWRGNAWQLMPGTENHGPVRRVVVDPTDSKVIYLASSTLYRTTDGGASWVAASDNLKGLVNSLTFHPEDSSIVFAATTEGVFKGTDRGSTWTNLSSNLPSDQPSYMWSVMKVAVDPKNPSRLFLTRTDGVYRSTDGGESWTRLTAPGLLGAVDIAIDPTDSKIIYAAGYGGFYRSTDGGDHWTETSHGLAGFAMAITALQIDPRSPSILYIATYDGVYSSNDRGSTWHPLNAALPGRSAYLIAIDANAPGTLWVATYAGLYFADLRPDVLLIKGHQGSLVAGRLSSYTLTVANTGDEVTTGTVTVTDSLPPELTFVSASAPGWNTGVDGKSVRFSRVDPMPPHSTREITLQVEVSSAASGVCTNVAALSVDLDRNTADNFASVASNVVSGAIYAYPFVSGGDERFTGLALANYGDTEAAVQLTAFGQDGSPFPFFGNPAVLSIPARSQLAALASELFEFNSDAPQLGWIELWSSHPLGTMFQIGGATSLDGGSALSQPAKTLFFTRLMNGSLFHGRTGRMTVSLVNPGFQPVTVELRLIKDAHPATTARTITIPARGCIYTSPTEWFGDPIPEADYLRADVTQGDGLVGFEMIDAYEPQATISLPAATGDPGGALGQTLFSAQLAASHGFYTQVKLINTATESRKITLRATGDSGQPLADPVVVDLPAGASFDQDAATLFHWTSTERIGSLRAEANGVGIIGDVLFGDVDAGTMAAALPLQSQLMTEAVFGQVANGLGFFTGLAVMNPGQVETDVTIQVFANDGRQTGETVRRLAAGARLVGLVTELLPETAGQIGGYVRLVSDQPIVAQQLFGNGNILSAVIPTIVR